MRMNLVIADDDAELEIDSIADANELGSLGLDSIADADAPIKVAWGSIVLTKMLLLKLK